MPKIKIAIVIEGGVVQSVYSDQENVEVEIVDLDIEGLEEYAAEQVEKRADEVAEKMIEVY